jgi:hypothetical protein
MAHEFKFIPNLALAKEHVVVVKQSIRVVKERCRATFHGNPFKSLPRILKAVVQECTKKLNFFLVRGGCSDVYSPRMILHEINLGYDHCQVPQLAYVLAHDEPELMNSTQLHAIDVIYMRPLSNAQGSHEIFHVNTAEVIQRRNVTVLLITEEIVKAVTGLGKRDSMEAYKIESKHRVILCDSMIAGVQDEEVENQEEEEEAQSESEENGEIQDQQEEETGEEDNPEEEVEESGEEALQGTSQLKVR